MPGRDIKVFDPTACCCTGNLKIQFNVFKLSFDTFFWGFMRGGLFTIALALIFSNFAISNPFAHTDALYWYSLDVFAL